MPTRKKATTTNSSAPLSRAALGKTLNDRSDAFHAAVEKLVADMPGIGVHSVLLSVNDGAATDPCGGCPPKQLCLWSSTGGWVCH
jgi:hypothetical protein